MICLTKYPSSLLPAWTR